MDEELKRAIEEGQILSIGETKSQQVSSKSILVKNLSSIDLQQIQLNLGDYNSPIGVDFDKTLPVPEYLTYRAVLEIILQQEKLSKQKRYDVEQFLLLYNTGKITEFLTQLTEFLEKADSKKRFCIDSSYIILLTLRMILLHGNSKEKIHSPVYSLDNIATPPSDLDSGYKESEIIEKISIMFQSNPVDPNNKDLIEWTKLLFWSNTLLFHYDQFSSHKDEKFEKYLLQSIENQRFSEAIELINNRITGNEKSIPTDNETKPLATLTTNQLILAILWGMQKILH